jgi:CubicO group peptidase (beta-lactamase class C family)
MSLTLAALVGAAALAAPPVSGDAVDRLFGGWRQANDAGCAVAVAKDGRAVVDRAYGRAELEHAAPVTPGHDLRSRVGVQAVHRRGRSVAPREGRLSLQDDVRKHVPELPDYGRVITVADLLHHTSGLRDWRYVAGAAGNTLGTHVHTNGDALEIIRRQRSLDHSTGAEHAYTNSGYTLLAIIAERASGQTLAEYSRERIFQPLGMRSTQWRDNFRQVVKGRAVAYARAGSDYEQDMPFEHAHGAGGLLTTTGDLMRWNAALDADRLGITKALELRDGSRTASPSAMGADCSWTGARARGVCGTPARPRATAPGSDGSPSTGCRSPYYATLRMLLLRASWKPWLSSTCPPV